MPLERSRRAAGHADRLRAEAEELPRAAFIGAEKAVREMERIELGPLLHRLPLRAGRRPPHERLLIAACPPGALFLAERAVDRGEHHRGIAHPRAQIEHPPPTDALLVAEDLQQHVAIEVLIQR